MSELYVLQKIMKRLVIIGIFSVLSVVCYVMISTKVQEVSILESSRIRSELGYDFPPQSRIIKTSASIFSLADGDNYTWTIESDVSLLPWVESLAHLEYGKSWKAVASIDNREETSYITLSEDFKSCKVMTFRP